MLFGLDQIYAWDTFVCSPLYNTIVAKSMKLSGAVTNSVACHVTVEKEHSYTHLKLRDARMRGTTLGCEE